MCRPTNSTTRAGLQSCRPPFVIPEGRQAAATRRRAPNVRRCGEQLLAHMPDLRLTLLVGAYAQDDALGRGKMTERVRDFRNYLPRVFPLPHPSWRSRRWAALNPWFDAEALPEGLSSAVRAALG